MTQALTQRRALYAARLYSRHHGALCVVYQVDGVYNYDVVTAKGRKSPANRKVIAMVFNGKVLEPPSCS